MNNNQVLTPIAIKLDGIHTGEIKEVLIDKSISLLVMLINRDTIFETMYCCDGLGDNQMPYIAFKYDYRIYEVLNKVFDRIDDVYTGSIRTEIQVKYLRDVEQKQKAIIIRGVVGKSMVSKLSIQDKVSFLNAFKDALRTTILTIDYNVQHWRLDLDNYWLVRNVIGKMNYHTGLNS